MSPLSSSGNPTAGVSKRSTPPEAVAALEAFATGSRASWDTPQLYQLNRARLALADRHELLRRATHWSQGQLYDVQP